MIITDTDGVRWIKTGDLGHITEDGLLFHEGRIRRIYLTSYEGQPAKIFPMLVEEKIKTCNEVFDCVVVARAGEDHSVNEPVAYIILNNDSVSSEKLPRFCHRRKAEGGNRCFRNTDCPGCERFRASASYRGSHQRKPFNDFGPRRFPYKKQRVLR